MLKESYMNNLKVCVLSSGSKGNSTYIETPKIKLLIDIGVSTSYIESSLKELMINPNDIEGIFITHTHVDHITGLKVFIKKYHPKIYLTKKMLLDIEKEFRVENYELIEEDFILKDLNIKIIKTSHDVSDSNGYVFELGDKSIVYITDTGYINNRNDEKLKNKSIYIMESNHDVNMLMNGKYPYHLKQRILSDNGHLSNIDSSYYLSKYIGPKTKIIFLAHLSDDNNTEELAINTLKETLKENNISFNNIKVARQKEKTEMITI